MASPLRSWSLRRFDRLGVAGLLRGRGGSGRPARAAVEPLENRQLFASSLVSVDSSGLAGGNASSADPDISSDGRYVVFQSSATDLVDADTGPTSDIYLRDLQTGVTKLVSVDTTGNTPGNGSSTDASVSDDGRYVIFTSAATNLVAGDTNNRTDVFIRDLFLNTTALISTDATGTGFGNGNSVQGRISDNGKFVAFTSESTNLVAGDSNPARDVYLRDLINNTTTLVSATTLGAGGNGPSEDPFVSATGQYVAFVSSATDLPVSIVPGPGNNVYLFNTGVNVDDPTDPGFGTAGLSLVSTTGANSSGGGATLGDGAPSVTDDGRFVAFSSSASDLVAGDVNLVADIFRHDTVSNFNALVSQSTSGIFGNGASTRPKISSDGRYVSFTSTSTNLATPDNGSSPDIFIRDLNGPSTALVSANLGNTNGAGGSVEPAMTDDARVIAYSSTATTLVTEPVQGSNIYVGSTSIFLNDTVRPTFRVAAPQPAGPLVGGLTLPFTIEFEDDTSIDTSTLGNVDIVVTGPNGFTSTATLFALTSNTVLTTAVATVVYTVPAPGGQLTSADNGTYTVTLLANQIADGSRNFVFGAVTGTFDINLPASETVLPAPTFTGGSPLVGSQTYDFVVTYEERGGIDFQTFGNDDILVTGPAGFSQNAIAVSSTPLSATTTSVIYRITAPGGVWDANDAGVYTANVIAGGVLDVQGNSVQDGAFGTFTALGADLVAIKLRNLRSGAISGIDQQKAKVRVLNQGTFPTTVPVAVTLYTSLDETLDPGDATIGTFIEERPINADDYRDIKVKFTYPQVPEGDYFILSQVDSANAVIEQVEVNNIASSFRKVGLSEPFVDLVPTLVPFPGIRSRISDSEATIKLRNAGNVEVSADIVIGLTAVSDTTPVPSERPVANVPLNVKLKPGQSKTFKLTFNFPIEFERGTYKLIASVDSTNVVLERDEINNRVESLSSFTFA